MPPLEVQVKRSYYLRVLVIGLFTLGLGALAMLAEQQRWVRTFEREGVTRRDGQRFRWQDLQAKNAVYVRQGPLSHYELVFTGGKALVFPRMLENEQDVLSRLEALSAPGQAAP